MYNILQSIKLFIIQHPLECLFFGMFIFTWTGSYLESIFKFWNWGPYCTKCDERVVWSDSVIHCTECDYNRCNDEYQEGIDKGILETKTYVNWY
jgi:hypothetical protein